MTLRSPAVTTRGPKDESYPDFQKRVAADNRRVKVKCDALDAYTPRCTWCGQICNPIEAGRYCKENGVPMVSRWAAEKADRFWFDEMNFARGGWQTNVEALAGLLDRTRAEAITTPSKDSL